MSYGLLTLSGKVPRLGMPSYFPGTFGQPETQRTHLVAGFDPLFYLCSTPIMDLKLNTLNLSVG